MTTRQAISDAIDLDVYTNEEDFEELGISGRLSRRGLELYRPMQPAAFDVLRTQAAEAIAPLVGPDSDGDDVPDHLDNCSAIPNPAQEDTDVNGTGDLCNSAEDTDGDEFADDLDNCPSTWNPTQAFICAEASVPALTQTGIVVLVLALIGFGAYGPLPYSLFYTGACHRDP